MLCFKLFYQLKNPPPPPKKKILSIPTISEGSCDWNNDAENSALRRSNKITLKNIFK